MISELGLPTQFPAVRLIHFERARTLNRDSNFILTKLEEHIDYEGMRVDASGWIRGSPLYSTNPPLK